MMQTTLKLFVKGMMIGVANIIPGVSGGTLAVVLGIYEKLIEAISNILTRPQKRKEYFIFLTTIFLGIGTSIVLLANVMNYLLLHHYHLTLFGFMGLIFGGLPAIWRAHPDMKVTGSRIAAVLMGVLVVILPALCGPGGKEAAMAVGEVPAFGVQGYAFLLFSGFMAGGGMIVPGVSGSFILVLMGQYAIIISAIKGFVIAPLVFVAVGAGAGIFVFSNIIQLCLRKAPAGTYYFILGLLAASLWAMFPGMPTNTLMVLAGGVIFFVGAGISYLLIKMGS